ncbi:ECU10_0345 [Encephalitozoon cuniculi GB-M1]|uniref:ECU10_0345 protein n=1 Tax=Encephalitozoon cuniculi (strain GB-M1) TaxID=284813 RepID=I7IV49_ENCCU|nr:uncharacterized protein ECU10_0345 [Encephalitozoon cuniculi GB-M1]CCI73986.1 ECU10_0345 [Encephalitozoon cuniculi GB-M1]
MVGLKKLKLSASLINSTISKVGVKCTREAKELLSESMVISAAFLFACIDHFANENTEEEAALACVLKALKIPISSDECCGPISKS